MATFAVATVLAVRFPKLRWPVILWAITISVSRLFRASHFLTDVVAGAVLGVLIGAVSPIHGRTGRVLDLGVVDGDAAVGRCLALMTTIGIALLRVGLPPS